MALTQITTDGIKNGTITGTDLTTNVDFVDNQKLRLGTGNDLQIYHDGSHSHLNNVTGNLLIGVEGEFQVLNRQENEFRIRAHNNGGVDLYYDNTKRFETSPTGATVTGILISDGFDLLDDEFLRFGASQDFEIHHATSGTVNVINSRTGPLEIRHLAEVMAKFNDDGAVELYHNNSKKFNTRAAGIDITGDLRFDTSVTGGIVRLADNQKVFCGSGDDLQIYHDGTTNIIEGLNGNMSIRPKTGENGILLRNNGAVELYFDDSKKFETTSNGVHITGDLRLNDNEEIYLGASTDFQLFHDPSVGNIIKSAFCNLVIKDTSGTTGAIFKNSGAVELNHNGSKKFETQSAGGTLRGTQWVSDCEFVPNANNTYDLGISSLRWRNIYTNDLNLSNEGGANDVDGTWGSYTIQEGAEDLFLVNKRNGKKYKFALTEVS